MYFCNVINFHRYGISTDPKVSLVSYVVSYLSTFVGYAMIAHVFVQYPELSLLTLGGMFINLYSFYALDYYQMGVMVLLVSEHAQYFTHGFSATAAATVAAAGAL
jgi:hypothetical protein